MRLPWMVDGSVMSDRDVSSRPAVQPVPLEGSHSPRPAAACESSNPASPNTASGGLPAESFKSPPTTVTPASSATSSANSRTWRAWQVRSRPVCVARGRAQPRVTGPVVAGGQVRGQEVDHADGRRHPHQVGRAEPVGQDPAARADHVQGGQHHLAVEAGIVIPHDRVAAGAGLGDDESDDPLVGLLNSRPTLDSRPPTAGP